MVEKIILRPPKKQPKSYGQYFLFEAPGDPDDPNTPENEAEEPVPEPEVQEVNPDDDTDFNPIGDDEPDVTEPDPYDDTNFNEIDDTAPEPVEPATDEPAPADVPVEDQPTDVPAPEPAPEGDMTGGEEPAPAEEPTPTDDTGTEPAPVETPTDAPVDQPADDTGGEVTPPVEDTGEAPAEPAPEGDPNAGGETPAEGEDAPAEEPVEDDTNFNDMDGGGGDTTTSTTTSTDSGDNEKKGPGVEYDSTRKYVLFKEFMSLYNAINNYITKLESVINDDIETNRTISEAANRLREIRDLTYDYMTMKYEISTYTQSLLFYQTLIVSVQMVFRLLENIDFSKKEE